MLAEQNVYPGSGLLLPSGSTSHEQNEAQKPWEPPMGVHTSPAEAVESPRGSTMELTGLTATMLRNSVMDLTGLSAAASDSMQDDAEEGQAHRGPAYGKHSSPLPPPLPPPLSPPPPTSHPPTAPLH